MAITEPIESAPVPVARDNRTWRMHIFCEANVPVTQWSVEWLREIVQRDADGNVVGERIQHAVEVAPGVTVDLKVAATAADLLGASFTDPATGKTMTGAEIMSMLAYIGDLRWQQKVDAAIAAAQPEPEPDPE